ncbi:MAG: hypothetical protein WAU24_12420 [Chitinophagaceae bacterium]
MTQKEFASQMLQVVDNSREIDGKSDEEIVKELTMFMSVLEPKNRETFSQWGFPKDKSTVADCWE